MATSTGRSPGVKAALYECPGAAAEVLRGAGIERPDPGPGEVRVEVSGVNPTDWKLRSGATPQAIDRFQIPHHDAAGGDRRGRRGRQPGAPRAAGLDLAGRGRVAVGNGGRVDRDPGAAGGPAARGRLTRAWREPRRASDDRVLVPLRRWAADRADGAYRWGRRAQ